MCSPKRPSISELCASLASKGTGAAAAPSAQPTTQPASLLRALPGLAAGLRGATEPAAAAGAATPERAAPDSAQDAAGEAQQPCSSGKQSAAGGMQQSAAGGMQQSAGKARPVKLGFGRLPGMGAREAAAVQLPAQQQPAVNALHALPRLPPRPQSKKRRAPAPSPPPPPMRWRGSPLQRLIARAGAPRPATPDQAPRAGRHEPLLPPRKRPHLAREDDDGAAVAGAAAAAAGIGAGRGHEGAIAPGARGAAVRPIRQRQPARKVIDNAEAGARFPALPWSRPLSCRCR